MSDHTKKAPIVLFVYNRPAHTRQTVEALQKNDLAKDSDLIIYSDAPKAPETAAAVREVREYIRTINGFKSVAIVERETNYGLARSIIEGVTRLCEEYGRVIVLEDDLVASPYFLQFMNDALDTYEHEDRVMHISGSTYPIEAIKDETFFLRVPLCWGWATWNRAWRHFKKSDDLMLKFDQAMRREFSFNNSFHYWEQFEANAKGSMNTWFVYWYAALFLRGGLALFPGKSLVRNIGMDGSGVHSGVSHDFDIEPCASAINVIPIPVVESRLAVKRHESFFRKTYSGYPLHTRIYNKAIKIIRKLILSFRIS
jgi:hypothetical protein